MNPFDDNFFWCWSCKKWSPYSEWIAKRSIGDNEAEYCKACVKMPDNIEEFDSIVRELSDA